VARNAARNEATMHIPNGYLSPSTCAVLYGTSLPFWYTALRKVRGLLNTQFIPRISLFAAFSFIVMMFNLPLPGGTTGHAVGVGIAAIVLGPWASMLAISITLVIQAVFFGDGGITSLGANCFNMAIIGSLVAYGVNRVLAGDSPPSRRRVFAAAMAGYTAINVSAFLAAIELGIQPMLFRDASGAPLYAPYSLRVALPAMMIGHLTFAGLAEMLVSGGLVAYLQRADPALLGIRNTALPGEFPSTRAWTTLGLLMVLTPLGLLAVGSAWGEWDARDFADPAARHAIAAASANQAPPPAAPSGLTRLASVWTAPFPKYAPQFIKSPTFGYVMSAFLGVGLVILSWLLLRWASR
jgi:cobalt/nickel transport system permease protein